MDPAEPRRRPSFTAAFPSAPPLDALVDAFERGNYARVRAEAPRLAAATDDPAVRDAALTLVERTKPDRLAVGLLVITGVLLATLTGYWVVHGKAPPNSAPPRPPMEQPH